MYISTTQTPREQLYTLIDYYILSGLIPLEECFTSINNIKNSTDAQLEVCLIQINIDNTKILGPDWRDQINAWLK